MIILMLFLFYLLCDKLMGQHLPLQTFQGSFFSVSRIRIPFRNTVYVFKAKADNCFHMRVTLRFYLRLAGQIYVISANSNPKKYVLQGPNVARGQDVASSCFTFVRDQKAFFVEIMIKVLNI